MSTPTLPLRIFASTYNLNMKASNLTSEALRTWLAPAFVQGGEEPDMVVVGVQELLPLQYALAGWTTNTLQTLSSSLSLTLSSFSHSTYPSISFHLHGGVALFLFVKDSLTKRLGKVVKSSVALGDAGMGNKAAVGVRVVYNRGEGGEECWESFTFISAHLAAHDYNLPRRQTDYTTILTSLLFPSPSVLTLPHQIFHSSHTFLMGDLNYRLSSRPRSLIREGSVDSSSDFVKEREEMLGLETLKQEQLKGKTMVGMREGDLRAFAPTYKRIIGSVEGYSSKRIPGWTDRILVASYTDPSIEQTSALATSETEKATTEIKSYNSVPELVVSDHKPVYSLFVFPPAAASTQSSQHTTPSLSHPLPPARDHTVLMARMLVGKVLDRVVGWAWIWTLLVGGGNLTAGLAVDALLVILGVWWAAGIWPF